MKPIEVKLSLPVVAPLLDVIKGLLDDLKSAPAVPPVIPGTDLEFSEAWAGELIAAQLGDVNTLLSLFGGDFFTDGVVYFDKNNAEAITRACSAVRLRLRERFLIDLEDEALEAGDIDISQLADPVRKAFMCYLFLATIQELIIQHMDDVTA